MPENIAMTPPMKSGEQVFWDVRRVNGAELFLPAGHTPIEDELEEFSQDGERCLPELRESRSVRVANSDGIFYRVWSLINEDGDQRTAWEYHVTWLRSNIMLKVALEHSNPPLKVDIGNGDELPIRTPHYYGAAYYVDGHGGFHSLVAMSDESEGREPIPDPLYYDIKGDRSLNCSMHRLLGDIYPGYNTYGYKLYLDNNRNNILYGEDKDDLVKIDVNRGRDLDF